MISLENMVEYNKDNSGIDANFYHQGDYGYLQILTQHSFKTALIKFVSIMAVHQDYGGYLHKVIITNNTVVFQVTLLKKILRDDNTDNKKEIINIATDELHFTLETLCKDMGLTFSVNNIDSHAGNVGWYKKQWVLFDALYSSPVLDSSVEHFVNTLENYNISIMIG